MNISISRYFLKQTYLILGWVLCISGVCFTLFGNLIYALILSTLGQLSFTGSTYLYYEDKMEKLVNILLSDYHFVTKEELHKMEEWEVKEKYKEAKAALKKCRKDWNNNHRPTLGFFYQELEARLLLNIDLIDTELKRYIF